MKNLTTKFSGVLDCVNKNLNNSTYNVTLNSEKLHISWCIRNISYAMMSIV